MDISFPQSVGERSNLRDLRPVDSVRQRPFSMLFQSACIVHQPEVLRSCIDTGQHEILACCCSDSIAKIDFYFETDKSYSQLFISNVRNAAFLLRNEWETLFLLLFTLNDIPVLPLKTISSTVFRPVRYSSLFLRDSKNTSYKKHTLAVSNSGGTCKRERRGSHCCRLSRVSGSRIAYSPKISNSS